MQYATIHANLATRFTDAGAAVTFTQTLPGTYSSTTDTWSSLSTVTVAGTAVRVKGNPLLYQALSLILVDAPTLLFRPTTYGQFPALGSTVTWNAIVYTVRAVDLVAPDGTAILARVIVAR